MASKASSVSISRGMDFRKYIEAARLLNVTISEPHNGQSHWVFRCEEVHGLHAFHLGTARTDTPWAAFQWLRKVKDFRVQQEKTAENPRYQPALPNSQEILQQLREAKIEAAAAAKQATYADQEVARLTELLEAAKQLKGDAEIDQLSAEDACDQLRKDLDAALDREIQGDKRLCATNPLSTP